MNDWRMYTDGSGEERNHVAWHEVLKAISELDGREKTLVHAAYGEHVDLVIGGGNDGSVLVQWKEYEPGEQHFVLVADRAEDAVPRVLTIEGAGVELPATWCIPLEQAVPVCGDILRTCEKPEYPALRWIALEL